MKLVLKSNKINEASRRNVGDAFASAIKYEIERFFVKNIPNPAEDIRIDVRPLMAQLANRGPKYKKVTDNLKTILLTNSFMPGGNLGHYDFRQGELMLKFPRPYSGGIYEKYVDLKKEPAKVGPFQTALKRIMKKNLEKKSNIKSHPNAYAELTNKETPIERVIELYKKYQSQNSYLMNPAPEYTTSKSANEYNLNLFDKGYSKEYYTQEAIKKEVELALNPKTIHDRVVKTFNDTTDTKGEALGSVLSTLIHEVTHGRQDLGSEHRPEKFTHLFKKENYLLLPPNLYNNTGLPLDSIKPSDADQRFAFGKFHYFTRPYEIDARLSEYRRAYANLKKVEPKTADSKIFDIISKREIANADSVVAEVSIMPLYHKYAHLIKDEVKYKLLAQVFNQIVRTGDTITKDPRFKEELLRYRHEAEDVTKQMLEQPELKRLADSVDREKIAKLVRSTSI